MRRLTAKAVSLVLLFALIADSACYGLATIPASQNPLIKREILAALQRTQIRYADSEDAVKLLNANDAECLLLSSGKYLVTKDVAQDNLRLLRAIIHEDIEAIMQILAKDDRRKYQGIKELILKHFPPSVNNSLPIDLYINHTAAKAFEWLSLLEDKTIVKSEIPPREIAFIDVVRPIIIANKHNYFTTEFWDSRARSERIRVARNNGMVFYQTTNNGHTALEQYLHENIIPLGQDADIGKIGNKARSFVAFGSLGLPYPEGFTITSDAVKLITSGDEHVLNSIVDKIVKLFNFEEMSIVNIKLVTRSSPVISMPGILATEEMIDSKERLAEAIKHVALSWNKNTAKSIRKTQGISEESGMGIIVQRMVTGNVDSKSGSGVIFSRNPDTGENRLFGNFAIGRRGKDIVSGEACGDIGLDILRDKFPLIYERLKNIMPMLEAKLGYAQEVEFVIERGMLYLLQTRNIQFAPQGENRYIQDAIKEGLISDLAAMPKLEVLQKRIKSRKIYKIKDGIERNVILRCEASTPGAMAGRAVFSIEEAEKLSKKGENVILILRPKAYAGYAAIDIMDRILNIPSIGLVLLYGNPSSHEAVLARLAGIPTIINASSAKEIMNEGDFIAIDGVKGEVFKTTDENVLVENRAILDTNFEIDINTYRSKFTKPYLKDDGTTIKPDITYQHLLNLNLAAWIKFKNLQKDNNKKRRAFIANLEKHFLHELLLQKAKEVGKSKEETNKDLAALTDKFERGIIIKKIFCIEYFKRNGYSHYFLKAVDLMPKSSHINCVRLGPNTSYFFLEKIPKCFRKGPFFFTPSELDKFIAKFLKISEKDIVKKVMDYTRDERKRRGTAEYEQERFNTMKHLDEWTVDYLSGRHWQSFRDAQKKKAAEKLSLEFSSQTDIAVEEADFSWPELDRNGREIGYKTYHRRKACFNILFYDKKPIFSIKPAAIEITHIGSGHNAEWYPSYTYVTPEVDLYIRINCPIEGTLINSLSSKECRISLGMEKAALEEKGRLIFGNDFEKYSTTGKTQKDIEKAYDKFIFEQAQQTILFLSKIANSKTELTLDSDLAECMGRRGLNLTTEPIPLLKTAELIAKTDNREPFKVILSKEKNEKRTTEKFAETILWIGAGKPAETVHYDDVIAAEPRKDLLSELINQILVNYNLKDVALIFDIDGTLNRARNEPLGEKVAEQLADLLALGADIQVITGKSKEELDEYKIFDPLFEILRKRKLLDLIEGFTIYTSDGGGKYVVDNDRGFNIDAEYSKPFTVEEAGIMDEIIREISDELEEKHKLKKDGIVPFIRNFGDLKFNLSPYGNNDKTQYAFEKDEELAEKYSPRRKTRKEIAQDLIDRLNKRGVVDIDYIVSGSTTIGLVRKGIDKTKACKDILKTRDYTVYVGDEIGQGNDAMITQLAKERDDLLVVSVDNEKPSKMHEKVIWLGKNMVGTQEFLDEVIKLLNNGLSNKMPYDIEPAVVLTSDLLHTQLNEDTRYEIKYDSSRLSASQIDIIEAYVKLLKARTTEPDNIRVKPFSSAKGSKESLIAVYCAGKDFKGEAHVDAAIPEGELKDYILKVTGMLNIAMASASIPDNLSKEDLDKYRPIISYIQKQYESMLGESLIIPDDPEGVLKVIRRIVIGLPRSMRKNTNQIEEYNRLAKEALMRA